MYGSNTLRTKNPSAFAAGNVNSLCIAEKPSVGREIARVIGADTPHNGYIEGNGYIVTWAVGHLVTLAEPSEYGYVPQKDVYTDGMTRAYEELPLIPDSFKLVVLEKTAAQFEIVKRLMHRPDVDRIIDCGDMGTEGHVLQWLIREKAGNNKTVLRFCATSMTDEAIKQAMSNLRPIEQFNNVIKGGFCKKKADWILGMSLSRAMSIKYRAGVNVGRVQSPTLYFVVKRFLELQNFVVTDYYTMTAALNGGFSVYWNKDSEGRFPQAIKDSDGRVLDKNAVERVAAEIVNGGVGTVTKADKQKKATNRPQLYDITELQRDANVRFGYTAADTLSVAQSLYETHKVLSYPRTDSRYITTDLIPYVEKSVEALVKFPRYEAAAGGVIGDGLNFDKRVTDNGKVTDHHALIPTDKLTKLQDLTLMPTEEDKKRGITGVMLNSIFDLVLCRLIVALSQPYLYEHTDIEVKFTNGFIFSAVGNTPVSVGWKRYQELFDVKANNDVENEGEAAQSFPPLTPGQSVGVSSCVSVSKKTVPPKLHTEATLLTAMETAGQYIENGAVLRKKGLGTQATRAEIIKKLFDTGVVEGIKKGKTNYIQPTSKGLGIIRVMPHELYSPKITADWETVFSEIEGGKASEHDFMARFIPFVNDMVSAVKGAEESVIFKKERESHGVCPWCGKDVYCYEEKNKTRRYYCAEKCGFSFKTNETIFGAVLGKNLSTKDAKRFIADGSITLTDKSDKKITLVFVRKDYPDKTTGVPRPLCFVNRA